MAKAVNPAHQNWRWPQFWRNLFLYFWCFSFIGHIAEIFWALFGNWVGFRETPASTIPLFAIAVPYGFGAVLLLLVLYPRVKKKQINLVVAFVLGALITTIIELICSLSLVVFMGSNPFWDYSGRFLNLYGHVCLMNSIMFGLGAVVMLKWVFPWTERILVRIRARYVNVFFWILFVGYILSQIDVRFLGR